MLNEMKTFEIDHLNMNSNLIFEDREVTDQPVILKLILSSKNVNEAKMELLNPRGYYCIYSNAKNMNGFSAKIHCNAHLAVLQQDYQQANGYTTTKVGVCE